MSRTLQVESLIGGYLALLLFTAVQGQGRLRATPLCRHGVIILFTVAVSECTSGFMQLELLKRRAEKISSANLISETSLTDGETRVMPGLNFTCNGNITGLLLAVDLRTVGGSIVQYPQIQVWEPSTIITLPGFYTRGDHQNISLSAGDDFSTDGVLQYNLSPPLSFQSGDLLGVYQPERSKSVVRLFYANDPGTPIGRKKDFFSTDLINIHQDSEIGFFVFNQSVLLSLKTGTFKKIKNPFIYFLI